MPAGSVAGADATAGSAGTAVLQPGGSTLSHGSPPELNYFFCESGDSQVSCFLSYDSPDPATVARYVNGSHVPTWDDRTWISTGCNPSTTIKAVVSNEHGSVSTGTWSHCITSPWR